MSMRTIAALSSLKGRVALVAGGAGPSGRALAETFAELGAAVALLDRPGSGAEDLARSLTDIYGVLATAIVADPGDEAAVRKAPQRVVDTCGRLDVLAVQPADLPAAGAGPIEEQSAAAWRAGLEAGLTAPFLLIQQAVPALRASGKGSVVLLGGLATALGADPRRDDDADSTVPVAAAAAGGGLLQTMRWLAAALAPQVRVNAIVAGAAERSASAAVKRRIAARTPLGRMMSDEDLKGAAAYLASDLSAFVTGQCLTVDGGWSAW
jgi:NAD(P)-dependent dehydrogenase (short-subunit alcohol dehydrogenase family)